MLIKKGLQEIQLTSGTFFMSLFNLLFYLIIKANFLCFYIKLPNNILFKKTFLKKTATFWFAEKP